ncbi:MAG: TRAP transporter small permease subunit, partial [Pseudomonadota bacterium]
MTEFVEITGTGLRVLGYGLSPFLLLPFAVLVLPGVFGGAAKAVSGLIDRISGAAMGVAVFAAFAIILIQLTAVILRYVFGLSFSWLNDSVIFSFAMIFMLGAAGTLRDDGH